MASNSVWAAASGVSNGTCSWRQEDMLSSNTESFKPTSKWRILRRVFSCTRIWRDVCREAQNLRVGYTLDLQFRSVEVNQDSATSKSRLAKEPTLPTNMSLTQFRETKPSEKSRLGCKRSCHGSQDLLFFGQVYKPCNMFPLVCGPQQPILEAVVVVAVVFLSLGDRYPADHVDWGGWGSFDLLGTSLESNNTCVSIVTLFQAASILLFQAAYFWLKFREALGLSFGLKRKHSEFQGEGDAHRALKGMYASSKPQGLQVGDNSHRCSGVYAREVEGKSGTHYKYEPRFKPPRAKLDSGSTLQLGRLSLGQYNTPVEAKIVHQIAAFYYGKDEGKVELEDGSHFSIPPMTPEEQRLWGEEKRQWVTQKAKELFQSLPKDAKWKHPRRATSTEAQFGSGNDGSDFLPSRTAEDTPPSLLPEIQIDTPSTDGYGEIAGNAEDFSDLDENVLNFFGDSTVPPHCNHNVPGFQESCQPELEPRTLHPGFEFARSSIFVRQTLRDPVPVQPANRHKEQLEFAAVQNVDLQYQLAQAQDYISELEQEVELLRSELQRVAATSQVAVLWNHT